MTAARFGNMSLPDPRSRQMRKHCFGAFAVAFAFVSYALPPTVGQLLNQNLNPSIEGIRFVLDFLAEKQPHLKNKNPADFVDLRFPRKLDEEGFFKKFTAP